MPTVTLDLTDRSPTPTPSATSQIPASATLAISPTPTVTPSPTPTACPVPADWQRYIVGPFDTLALLAQRFNLSPDQLARANCLTQPSSHRRPGDFRAGLPANPHPGALLSTLQLGQSTSSSRATP